SELTLTFSYTPLSLLSFFNDPPTTEIYTLSLHDALPICKQRWPRPRSSGSKASSANAPGSAICLAKSSPLCPACCRIRCIQAARSEEHTSELQSRRDLVCRLLLEKKKKINSKQQS